MRCNACLCKWHLKPNNNNIYFTEEVLHASDELSKVFDKYTAIIIKGVVPFRKISEEESLLDLGSPNASHASLLDSDHLSNNVTIQAKLNANKDNKPQSDIDALCDIFSNTKLPAPMSPIDTINMLKPTMLQTTAQGIIKIKLFLMSVIFQNL